MTEPSPPDPDDEAPPRRRLAAAAFWAAMALALACILGGLAIARYGPGLFPVHAPAVASPPKPD